MKPITERLSRGTWYSLVSIPIVKLFTVANSTVTARLLGPSDFGIYSILLSLQGILLICAAFGYPTVVTKFIAEYNVRDPFRVKKIYYTSFLSIMILALVMSLFFFLSANFIALRIYHEKALKSLIQLMCGGVFLVTIVSLNLSTLQGLHKIKLLSQLNILNSILSVVLIYLLVSHFGLIGAPISGIIAGMIFVSVTIAMISRFLNLKQGDYKLTWDKDYQKKAFKLSLPLFLSSLVVLFALWIAKTYLARKSGMREVGFYQIAESLNYVIGYVPFAISIPFLPIVSELESLEASKLPLITSKILKYSALVTLPIALAIGLFAKFIICFLFGKPYQDAWEITYILSAGSFLMSFGILIGAVLNGTGRMWHGLGLNLVWMVLFTASCTLLIPKMGLIGLGYSYISSYILYTAILFYYSMKILGTRIVELRTLIITSIIFFPVGWLLVKTYSGLNLLISSIFLLFSLLGAEYFFLSKEERSSLMKSLKQIVKSNQLLGA